EVGAGRGVAVHLEGERAHAAQVAVDGQLPGAGPRSDCAGASDVAVDGAAAAQRGAVADGGVAADRTVDQQCADADGGRATVGVDAAERQSAAALLGERPAATDDASDGAVVGVANGQCRGVLDLDRRANAAGQILDDNALGRVRTGDPQGARVAQAD